MVGVVAVSSLTSAGPPEVESHVPTFTIGADVPAVSAPAFIIVDADTNQVIASAQADAVRSIASISKLPAAAAWLRVADQEATSTITWSDLSAEGRAGKLAYGEVYTHRAILFPLLLESSNDAAALMERVSEGEVVKEMNRLASELALSNTTFSDASGLSAQNMSTAAEVAKLAIFIKHTSPHLFDILKLSRYIGEYNGWVNNNPLIKHDGYQGGKHGFTYEANRTAVALFTESFVAGERTFVYVVLGSDDLVADIDELRRFVRESVRFE